MMIPSLITLVVCLWCGNGCRLCGSTCWICHRRWGIQRGIRCRHRGICRCRRYSWLAGDRHIRCRAPVKPSLQTVDLFKQCLLLLLHLAKQFSNRGVLRLHGLDFALQVLWLRILSRDFVLRTAWFGFRNSDRAVCGLLETVRRQKS